MLPHDLPTPQTLARHVLPTGRRSGNALCVDFVVFAIAELGTNPIIGVQFTDFGWLRRHHCWQLARPHGDDCDIQVHAFAGIPRVRVAGYTDASMNG